MTIKNKSKIGMKNKTKQQSTEDQWQGSETHWMEAYTEEDGENSSSSSE